MRVQKIIQQAVENKSKGIDLADCSLTEIPLQVFELRHLEVLKLGSYFSDQHPQQKNNLHYLPPQICQLKNLKELYLPHNLLSTLPDCLTELSQLQVLILTGNCFNNLPAAILDLKNLQLLYLTSNEISHLPEEIARLSNLKRLYLSRNRLETLPEAIGKLYQLEDLIADHNQLSAIPDTIGELKRLHLLSIKHNRLGSLPEEIVGLENLNELHLAGNQIRMLPARLFDLKKLRVVGVLKNPLSVPPSEIAQQGVAVTKAYFESVQVPEKTGYLQEVKLVLLGNGQVGKTTLRENLINPAYQLTSHASTEGLEVKNWDFPLDEERNIRLNIWDFGGQGEYRTVQQHFFTRNAIYLYVTEPGDDVLHAEDQYVGVRYWLDFIGAFGQEVASGKYPIIYVHNKCDKVSPQDDQQALPGKFPEVMAFVKVSCKTGEGINELRQLLKKLLLATNLTGVPINLQWLLVKHWLEEQNSPYIKYEVYITIAHAKGLTDNEARLWLRYLCSVGSLLYFPHILELQGYVFLQPNWIRLAAYLLLKHANRAGVLSKEKLRKLWASHPAQEQSLLLQVLRAFQLLYYSKEDAVYVLPSMAERFAPLPVKENLKPTQMWVECRFEPFMPAGLVAQLIVALPGQVYENLYWQNRAIFQYKNGFADVVEDWQEKKLILILKGKQKLPLLELLLQQVQVVGFQSQRVKFSPHYLFQTQILCPCDACKQDTNPYFYSYVFIKKLLSKKVTEAFCENSKHWILLKTLFGDA
ncbi:MAG: COR domain-containing protein [Cyclobacteriaceae bacterium]